MTKVTLYVPNALKHEMDKTDCNWSALFQNAVKTHLDIPLRLQILEDEWRKFKESFEEKIS